MQLNHVTMLLHNTLQLADTWVNPFHRGHHIFRHVLLCFPPLVVLLWALDAQNRWLGCVEPSSMPVFRFLGTPPPPFRTDTFTHTHTCIQLNRIHVQYISAHTFMQEGLYCTCTHLCMPHTQTLSHTHVALSILRSFPEFFKLVSKKETLNPLDGDGHIGEKEERRTGMREDRCHFGPCQGCDCLL